jgi:hypothetical protein
MLSNRFDLSKPRGHYRAPHMAATMQRDPSGSDLPKICAAWRNRFVMVTQQTAAKEL